MWIARLAAERLKELAGHYPAVALTGARQTGKTSLLRQVFPEAEFLSLDLPATAARAESEESLLENLPKPIIIDEVQYAPKMFRFLKHAIDSNRHKNGQFLLTGSQKFSLMRELSESLAGRVAILELDTLSVRELSEAGKLNKTEDALWRGGFPELYRNPKLKPADFFSSYVATYLERDVRQLIQVRSLRDFDRFLRACAYRCGGLLNMNDISRDLGIAGTTVRDWLSVLETSNQIHLLEPFHFNTTKRLIKSPKLYFRDTGLLCFLLGIDSPTALINSPFIGAIWENFVLQQILCEIHCNATGARIFFWRDAYAAEVDFVLSVNGRFHLIEAKWSESPEEKKAAKLMEQISKSFGKFAVAKDIIACRTSAPHRSPEFPRLHLLNPMHSVDWLKL